MAIRAFPHYGELPESNTIEAPEVTFRTIPVSEGEKKRLREKLGVKYDEIMDTYGAGEYIYDKEGNIVDMTPPEDYFREVDEHILHAITAGKEVDPSLVPTPSLLCQLARGQVSYLESYSFQLKKDPEFVQSLVSSVSCLRPELIPDENGKMENLDQMLKSPTYLCEELRSIFYNTFLELGRWSLVVSYLDDVVKIGQKLGYMGAANERQHLMDNARGVMKQSIENISTRIKGNIRGLKRFATIWKRNTNGGVKWRNSDLSFALNEKSDSLFCADTFDGHLFRFSLNPGPVAEDIVEFMFFMKCSNPEDINKLGISLVEDISMLHASYEFYDLLGPLNPDIPYIESIQTKRLEQNSARCKTLLAQSAIERHVRNVEGLKTENVLNKVWKEIDDLVFKKKKTTLPKRTRIQPKLKTRGIAAFDTEAKAATVTNEESTGIKAVVECQTPQPLFKVKKATYELFEKLFDSSVKGRVRQLDFIKVMTSPPLDFSLRPGHGSKQVLSPPLHRGISSQPFGIHRIHDRQDELDVRYENDYATRLRDDYGWTLDSFVIA